MLTGSENQDAEIPKSNRGGARPGAGRKPGQGVHKDTPKALADFNKAKARREKAKAELAELEVKRALGEYVERSSMQKEMASVIKIMAQGLDTLLDVLERDCGLAADVIERVQQHTDGIRESIFDKMISDEVS